MDVEEIVEKYWKDCSKEEHRKVLNLERRIKKNKSDFVNGIISRDKYERKKIILAQEIDTLEKLYKEK